MKQSYVAPRGDQIADLLQLQEVNMEQLMPLLKQTKQSKVGDLHPIILLPLPSKISERIVYGKLMNFLENNKYINDNQYGFRKNKSTTDAALKLVNDLYSYENTKLITSAIFVDYKKAFYSISHKTLLEKN